MGKLNFRIYTTYRQGYFYLVFYSKFANNILVYTAANGFLCMLELGQVANSQGMTYK